LETKISKIFVSTRPECCERLEQEFLQIKHSLLPFTEPEQKDYFLSFLKNKEQFKDLTETELKEIVEAFMVAMKESIKAKDFKHTGLPLVSKLSAEFLENKFSHIGKYSIDKTVANLKLEKFNLWVLYEKFITKSFDIYFKEKCGIDEKKATNRRRIALEKKKLLGLYKIYAIQEFLKRYC
jgi:hypothetical protein